MTAKEPSSSGATLTDGAHSPSPVSFSSNGDSTSRATPETTTGCLRQSQRWRADPQDAEAERRRPEAEPRAHVGRRQQHPRRRSSDEREGGGAARGGRHDDDVDDGGREPEACASDAAVNERGAERWYGERVSQGSARAWR